MSSRERFEAALQRLKQVKEEQRDFHKSMREAYNQKAEDQVRKAYFEKYPRRRKFDIEKACKDLGDEVVEGLFDPLVEEMQKRRSGFKEAVKELEIELGELADGVDIRRGPEPLMFASCSRSAYSTQTNYEGYAEGRAVLDALSLTKAGIEFDVRKTEHNYEVWTSLDVISTEALKYRPITFEDITEECYRQGLNPLVFFPLQRDMYDAWMQKYRDRARGVR